MKMVTIKYIKSNNSRIWILSILGKGIFIKKSLYHNSNLPIPNFNEYQCIKPMFKLGKVEFYKFNEDLYKRTLHDYFYNMPRYYLSYDRILTQFKKNIRKNRKTNEKECKNRTFFEGRTNILEAYLKSDICKYKFIYENRKYNIKKIILEIKEKLLEEKVLLAFTSQGDPTDTNITISGIFTDYDNYGYNSMIGEIAISFASIFTHGSYFYPKYHKKAYAIRKNILKKYELFKQKVDYKKNGRKIVLYPEFRILRKNKQYLLLYLKMFDKYKKDESFQYLKYYLCMRMLTPMRLDKMDFDDMIIIISYLLYIYKNINSLDDLINFIDSLQIMEEEDGKTIVKL